MSEGSAVTVRRATTNDLSIIHQMQVDWESEGITAGLSAESVEEISYWLGPYLLLAEFDGQVAGFIYATERISEDTGYFADGQSFVNIDDLYVRPGYRGGGIGAKLIRAITQAAERNGIDRFALSSNTKDFERIVRFYRSCGFQTWNVTMFRPSTDRREGVANG